MARLRREARRRGVSLAAVIRDAVDRSVPDDEAARVDRLELALRAAGSVASGSGDVAGSHDDVLSGERW
jgi:hypothetical protein